MRPSPSLLSAAAKLDIPYEEVQLRRGSQANSWVSPKDGRHISVEEAVLDKFRLDGWRGYSGEGGLILNLIKAMSFNRLSPRNRATYIEALYAQNVAFAEDLFAPEAMLAQVAAANRRMVEANFDVMVSRQNLIIQYEGISSTSSTSMLDYFPGLERWMFVELLEVAGNMLMHSIARTFATAPYNFRRGWPDITMWRGGELRFVEVKAPGDKLRDSQKTIVTEFAKPLGLRFSLTAVRDGEI